jgi:hypothetical protein
MRQTEKSTSNMATLLYFHGGAHARSTLQCAPFRRYIAMQQILGEIPEKTMEGTPPRRQHASKKFKPANECRGGVWVVFT